MKSIRWDVVRAGLASAWILCACSKADQSAPKSADPVAPGSAHAQSTVAGVHRDAPPREAAGQPAAEDPSSAKLIAIGSNDKQAVVALGAKKVAEADSYVLELAAPDKIATGAEAVVTLVIKPKAGWHLNKEFPTKLSVVAPAGVELKKAEQVLADATSWQEDQGQFGIRFSSQQAGTKDFTGKLRFAVCTETTCDPKKEELAWVVAVE